MLDININMETLLNKFNEEYSFLYDNYDRVAGYKEAVKAFDDDAKDPLFRKILHRFVEYRQDYIVSDREAAAFEFALTSFMY